MILIIVACAYILYTQITGTTYHIINQKAQLFDHEAATTTETDNIRLYFSTDIINGQTLVKLFPKNSEEGISKTTLQNQFENSGFEVISISGNANEFVGTGTEIEAKDQTGVQETYIAFLYGDVNGDGLVDLTDARKILNNTLNEDLEELYEKAGNVDNSENSPETDLVDARRILSFVIGSGDLINNTIEKDKVAPVIEVTPTTVELSVGDTFTKTEALQGVKATDNLDGDITSKIDISGLDTVDTSVEGTYTIKYNVTDYSGNVAMEVTRTIVVKAKTGPDVPDDDILDSMDIIDNGTKVTSLNLEVGDTKTLGIKFMNSAKEEIDASEITITPTTTSIATITKKDAKTIEIITKAEGTQTITIKSGDVTSTFTLNVTKPRLQSIYWGLKDNKVTQINVNEDGELLEGNNSLVEQKYYSEYNNNFTIIPVTFIDTKGNVMDITVEEFINSTNYINDGVTNKYNIVVDDSISLSTGNIYLFKEGLTITNKGTDIVKYIGIDIYPDWRETSGEITLQYGNNSNISSSFRVNIVEE